MYDTTWDDAGARSLIGEKNIDNLCGWAGDLQTFVRDVINNTNDSNDYDVIYKSSSALIGKSDTSFSMDDILADTDAVNINNLLGFSSLSLAFKIYYTSGYNTRYTSFINSVSPQRHIRGYVIQDFYSQARRYTTNLVGIIIPTKRGLKAVEWPLLEGIKVSKNQRNAIAHAFDDYIWSKVGDEK